MRARYNEECTPHCSSGPSGRSCCPSQSQATGMHLSPHAACRVMLHLTSSALDEWKANPCEFLASSGTREHLFRRSCSEKVIQRKVLQLTPRRTLGGFSTIKIHRTSAVMIHGNCSFWWFAAGKLPFASVFPFEWGWLALCSKRPSNFFSSGLILKTLYEQLHV